MQTNTGTLANETHLANDFFATAKSGSGTATAGYAPSGSGVTLAQQTISVMGGSQPHPNIQPYETVNFCIATSGIFPPRS
jgi:microcystin-dependent protein